MFPRDISYIVSILLTHVHFWRVRTPHKTLVSSNSKTPSLPLSGMTQLMTNHGAFTFQWTPQSPMGQNWTARNACVLQFKSESDNVVKWALSHMYISSLTRFHRNRIWPNVLRYPQQPQRHKLARDPGNLFCSRLEFEELIFNSIYNGCTVEE